jgi:hypothetical protein
MKIRQWILVDLKVFFVIRVMDTVLFSGPNKVMSDGSMRMKTSPDILRAYLNLGGKRFTLEDNKLTIDKLPNNHYFLYHSYKYFDNGVLTEGRWYDINFPLFEFEDTPNNWLRILLENYETGTFTDNCSIEVEFTTKAAGKLRGLLAY